MASTDAQKIEKYRAAANDKTIPQDVRNQYLDKANELELKAFGGEKKYAKGGAVVAKASAKAPMKKMADMPMPKGKGKPSGVALIVAPVKKLAKGGAVKPMAKKKC